MTTVCTYLAYIVSGGICGAVFGHALALYVNSRGQG